MSYTSQVKLAIPYHLIRDIESRIDSLLEKSKDFKEHVETYQTWYAENGLKATSHEWNLIRTANNIYTDNETYCVLDWNNIKFYEQYHDVKALLEVLDSYGLDEGKIYNICQVGEDGMIIREYNDNENLPFLYSMSSVEFDEIESCDRLNLGGI